MNGRTIRIHLVDGSPTGMLAAEIINWTGKVLVSPRSHLAALAKRDEARRTGIYFLVGADPDNRNLERVYVGESDKVLSRLAQHDKDDSKDFWTRTIIVTSKDENLTKSHVRFLESRLIKIVSGTGRAKLANNTAPPAPVLPEADVADMDYFLGQIQMILPVLGFSFLQPRPSFDVTDQTVTGATPIFVIESVGVKAEAREVNGEFVVLKGSTVRKQGTDGWVSYRDLRQQLIEANLLVEGENPEYFVFADDFAFASPSAAAAVILGRQANGRTEWKETTTRKSYANWQELQLKMAGIDDSET